MLLYHYTSHHALPHILRDGLSKGEVPLSDREWLNAVNLTADPSPDGHGLDGAREPITEEDAARLYLATGQHWPVGARFVNKRAVRITIKLPSADRNLKDWLPWARKRLSPDYLRRLVGVAGGTKKARTWKIYFGVIPPSAIVAVDVLEPAETADA